MLIRPPHNQDDCWSWLCYSSCCTLPPLIHPWPWNSSLLIFFFFFFLVTPGSMWDISSPTRDQTPTILPWKHEVLTTWLPGKSLKFPLKSSWELTLYRSPPFPRLLAPRTKQTFLSSSHLSLEDGLTSSKKLNLNSVNTPSKRWPPQHDCTIPHAPWAHIQCISFSSACPL